MCVRVWVCTYISVLVCMYVCVLTCTFSLHEIIHSGSVVLSTSLLLERDHPEGAFYQWCLSVCMFVCIPMYVCILCLYVP